MPGQGGGEKMKREKRSQETKVERRKLKIAFLDTIGTSYTGDTLERKGLGGSESAIIYMAKELTDLDMEVTVFNKCEKEGTYDGVRYFDLSRVPQNEEEFDILVNSRTVLPYIPSQFRNAILEEFRLSPTVSYDIDLYKPLVNKSRYKVLWLHDTFIMGENWFEDVLADGHFDEVFTLSDFHTHYIARARHGNRERFFEVLKKKIFETRNGIRSFYDEVDISAKDKNLFVYNASTTKGLVPLLNQIWPLVKKEIPEAKLTVVGGYYNLGFSQPDEIETKFRELYDKYNGKMGVSFTGIITQKEVADIMVKASYYIYPATFPETFGISAAEAMNYNVPLITTRFGALEEIAPESTSYHIEFPITRDMEHYHRVNPIAEEGQIVRFIELVKKAYYDPYLRQQKMYAANEFKPFLGWDTVALQWKHHFLKKLNLYMDRDELERFRYISGRLGQLYNRRFTNQEEKFEDYSLEPKNEIVVISPTFNSWQYTPAHILSVASQLYDNYTHYIIDDMSTDNTVEMAEDTIAGLPEKIRDKFKIVVNDKKLYAVGNQVENIKKLHGNPIIVLLDGDDFLNNDPDIFNYINRLHNQGAKFTYGSFRSLVDKIDLIAQPYPRKVLEERTYRTHLFNWGMPYTHLRTFRKEVFDKVDESNFKDSDGNYWKAGGDNSMFYPLMDKCQPDEIVAVQRILVRYNDLNPLNDFRVNRESQNETAEKIRNNRPAEGMVKVNQPLPDFKIESDPNADPDEIVQKIKENMEYVSKRNNEILENKKDIPDSPDEVLELARLGDSEAIRRFKLWMRFSKFSPVFRTEKDLPEHEIFRFKNIVSLAASNVKPGNSSVLDIGAGDGSLGRLFLKEGFRDVTCMDSAMLSVEINQQKSRDIRWIAADVETYEFNRRYDVIVLGDVMNSMENPLGLVERLRSKNLKDGGVIIFTLPVDPKTGVMRETITFLNRSQLSETFNYVEELSYNNIDGVKFSWYIGTASPAKIQEIEVSTKPRKRIIIGIPTARNIETDTFKSIYRLTKPEGYDVDFECFYGYNIDQVRNLMAHWTVDKGYEYMLFVDYDMILPQDTLVKLLSHDRDIVSGLYIQRRTEEKIPEMYAYKNGKDGAMRHLTMEEATRGGLLELAACGFGGVLIHRRALEKIGYPYFTYHHSIDFKDTVSEDVDFCMKAKSKGIKIYLDTELMYTHIGRIDLRP